VNLWKELNMDDFFAILRPEETIIGLIYGLLSVFNDEETIAEVFDKIGIRRATVVVDTNILLSDLKYCVQKNTILR
jgi:hypothetical protein